LFPEKFIEVKKFSGIFCCISLKGISIKSVFVIINSELFLI